MRSTDFLGRSERSELSQMEAAELRGISKPALAAGVIGIAMQGRQIWTTVVWRRLCAGR